MTDNNERSFSDHSHAPVFTKSTVYFVFNYSTEKPLDIHRAASRLLASGIAETVASPADDEVRVSPRYRELLKLWRHAHELHELSSEIDSAGMLSAVKKHPIWSARAAARAIRMHLAKLRNNDNQRAVESSTPNEEEKEEEETLPTIATIELIEESVFQRQEVNATQQRIERELHRPAYLDTEPYLRLRLRDSKQWLTLQKNGARRSPDDFSNPTTVQALLLLHRSGVIQITFSVQLPDGLEQRDFADSIFGWSPLFSTSEIAEPLVKHAARHWKDQEGPWLGSWSEEIVEGVRWRRMTFDSPTSTADLFSLYQAAIAGALRNRHLPEWQCYPIVCIDEVGCCGGQEEAWLETHSGELLTLPAGGPNHRNLRSNVVASLKPEERSLTKEYSLFTSPSKTLRINWNSALKEVDYSRHLWTILIFESALLQYWQLRALDRRLSKTRGGRVKVRSIQQEVIYGLEEYRQSTFFYGTATDIAEEVLKGWRAEKLYQGITDAADQLQQLVAAEETRRSSLRANLLASAAVVAALAIGLPVINDTLKIASSVPDEGFYGQLAQPLKHLANDGAGAWKVYLTLLTFTTITCIALFARRGTRRFYLRLRRRAGVKWPLTDIYLTEDEYEAMSNTPAIPMLLWRSRGEGGEVGS